MISMSTEKSVAYALDTLQERGKLFVGPGEDCYEGMIVGESAKEGDMVVNKPVIIDGHEYYITCASMGNPHCAVFAPSIDKLDLNAMGPKFEYNPLFPERVNVEFIEVVDERTLKVRVWERGSGETMACGTGACASAVAAVRRG